MGIPRANRLRRSRDFTRVRVAGRSWVNRWLVMGLLTNDLGRVRIGVAASRHVGGAVQRVRVRRLIREAVRPRLKKLSGGWDLVFVARPALVNASFEDVDQAVSQLLRRAGFLPELEQ